MSSCHHIYVTEREVPFLSTSLTQLSLFFPPVSFHSIEAVRIVKNSVWLYPRKTLFINITNMFRNKDMDSYRFAFPDSAFSYWSNLISTGRGQLGSSHAALNELRRTKTRTLVAHQLCPSQLVTGTSSSVLHF